MDALAGASTIISVEDAKTRPISLRRGVRQGDPLSPLLFNMVMDELLVGLKSLPEYGGTLAEGLRTPAMAFADDLILLEDEVAKVPILLSRCVDFFKERGLELNPAKCSSLSASPRNGVSVVHTRPAFRIGEVWIPCVSNMAPFKYLSNSSGIRRPTIPNLPVWLRNLARSPLKPDQRLIILRDFIIPKRWRPGDNGAPEISPGYSVTAS